MDPNHVPVADSAPYHDALEQCVDHWGLVATKTELVRDGVNHVFATENERGRPVIIRVSDGTIRQHGEIEGELLWLEHLLRHGCTVTTPIASRNGEMLETIDLDTGTFHVCCFERFGGDEVDPRTDPRWNDDLLRDLGREIGRIHRASDELRLPPGKDRKQWFESEFSQVPDPLPSGFHPEVAERMRTFTEEMRRRPVHPGHYGLIHRDVHAGNFLVEQSQIQMIDFDLGCYGWRAMDLSVLLFVYYYFPSHRVADASPERAGRVLATLAQGYREEHTLERAQLEHMSDLLKLREIIIYVATAGNVEHWQIATGNPQPTMAESMAWIEQLWLDDVELRVDLGSI